MNEQILKGLLGHSKGKSRNVTARYIKARDAFAISEVQRCGLGFNVPTVAAPADLELVNA